MGSRWDYDRDVVTITFDAAAVTRDALKTVIEERGYTVEPASPGGAAGLGLTKAPIDEQSPEFVRKAFAAAAAAGRVLLVDFGAPWCTACERLERETLQNGDVRAALKDAQLVHVDLDEHPKLGKAFGVSSIPDVFFVAPDGKILDRVRDFESPAAFLTRLRRAVAAAGG